LLISQTLCLFKDFTWAYARVLELSVSVCVATLREGRESLTYHHMRFRDIANTYLGCILCIYLSIPKTNSDATLMFSK
jgi:hypothetical protein